MDVLDRLRFAIAVARILLVKDTEPKIQSAQVDLGPTGAEGSVGIRDNTFRLAEFGFASNPPAGSDAVVIFPGGARSNGVIIATGHQEHRLKDLQEGDAALYDVRGVYIWLTADGPVIDAGGLDIMVQNAGTVTVKAETKIRCETPLLECTGDIVDNCEGNDVTLKQLRDAYNAHHHPGVMAGGGSTGGTDHPAT